jgi:hypothetical protein
MRSEHLKAIARPGIIKPGFLFLLSNFVDNFPILSRGFAQAALDSESTKADIKYRGNARSLSFSSPNGRHESAEKQKDTARAIAQFLGVLLQISIVQYVPEFEGFPIGVRDPLFPSRAEV